MEKDKKEQIKQHLSTMSSFAIELGKGLQQGAYRRERLPDPITDDFGTFTEKRELTVNRCVVSDELSKNRVVIFSLIDDEGTKKVVEIGKTPDKYNPNNGGQLLIDSRVGEFSDFFMAVQVIGQKVEIRGVDHGDLQRFFYLTPAEFESMSVAPGDHNFELPERNFAVTGTVKNVATLE